MFQSGEDQKQYIIENYTEVTDQRMDDDHWDLECTQCKLTRGFQVTHRAIGVSSASYGSKSTTVDSLAASTIYFKCPVCRSYKQWIVFSFKMKDAVTEEYSTRYFKVASLPSEGIEHIEELPTDPPALRIAYRQAVRAMDANAYLAAAAMFRRALQIITREILKAKPGNLANELLDVVGKTFNGITITNSFQQVGYIIKEAGNQGAHPDKDPDLLEFTEQDTKDLQNIFMELVSDLFVVPAAVQKAKSEFLARRKIASP